MVISIRLYLYQSWVSHVSIQSNCHVIILINCKSLIKKIKSIFRTPNVTLLCIQLQTYRCLGDYFDMHKYHFFGLGFFILGIHSNMSRHGNYQNRALYMFQVSMCAHFWKVIVYFLSKNDDFNLVGLLIHLLIAEFFL